MKKLVRRFISNTCGAVTVDWVVLTASIVVLGIMAAVNIATGTTQIGDNVGRFLETERPFSQNE